MTVGEILACEQAGITVTLPKPQRSSAKSEGGFGTKGFVYLADDDVYRCPPGERLTHRLTAEDGQKLRRYWTDACRSCPITPSARRANSVASRPASRRRLSRPYRRFDKNPDAIRTRRETIEHSFATMKMPMGATHRQPKVAQGAMILTCRAGSISLAASSLRTECN
jgi:hypothetical protein